MQHGFAAGVVIGLPIALLVVVVIEFFWPSPRRYLSREELAEQERIKNLWENM